MNDARTSSETSAETQKLLADMEKLEFRARMLLIEHRAVLSEIRQKKSKLDALTTPPNGA